MFSASSAPSVDHKRKSEKQFRCSLRPLRPLRFITRVLLFSGSLLRPLWLIRFERALLQPALDRPCQELGRTSPVFEKEIRLDQLELHEKKRIAAHDAVDAGIERCFRQDLDRMRRPGY